MKKFTPTPNKLKIYKIINDWIEKKGYAPTMSEISDIVKAKSRSHIHREIKDLAEHGYLNIAPRIARGISLTRKTLI